MWGVAPAPATGGMKTRAPGMKRSRRESCLAWHPVSFGGDAGRASGGASPQARPGVRAQHIRPAPHSLGERIALKAARGVDNTVLGLIADWPKTV